MHIFSRSELPIFPTHNPKLPALLDLAIVELNCRLKLESITNYFSGGPGANQIDVEFGQAVNLYQQAPNGFTLHNVLELYLKYSNITPSPDKRQVHFNSTVKITNRILDLLAKIEEGEYGESPAEYAALESKILHVYNTAIELNPLAHKHLLALTDKYTKPNLRLTPEDEATLAEFSTLTKDPEGLYCIARRRYVNQIFFSPEVISNYFSLIKRIVLIHPQVNIEEVRERLQLYDDSQFSISALNNLSIITELGFAAAKSNASLAKTFQRAYFISNVPQKIHLILWLIDYEDSGLLSPEESTKMFEYIHKSIDWDFKQQVLKSPSNCRIYTHPRLTLLGLAELVEGINQAISLNNKQTGDFELALKCYEALNRLPATVSEQHLRDVHLKVLNWIMELDSYEDEFNSNTEDTFQFIEKTWGRNYFNLVSFGLKMAIEAKDSELLYQLWMHGVNVMHHFSVTQPSGAQLAVKAAAAYMELAPDELPHQLIEDLKVRWRDIQTLPESMPLNSEESNTANASTAYALRALSLLNYQFDHDEVINTLEKLLDGVDVVIGNHADIIRSYAIAQEAVQSILEFLSDETLKVKIKMLILAHIHGSYLTAKNSSEYVPMSAINRPSTLSLQGITAADVAMLRFQNQGEWLYDLLMPERDSSEWRAPNTYSGN